MSELPSRLKQSDWILAGSFVVLFLSLVIHSKVQAYKAGQLIKADEYHEPIAVDILGAVKCPGTYTVMPGTPLKQILKKAKPNLEANLKGIDLEGRIEFPATIMIEPLKELTVRIEGEVNENIELKVPLGSRVSDLKGVVALKEGADNSIFKSRRKLKNEESIVVPKKGVVENSMPVYDSKAY